MGILCIVPNLSMIESQFYFQMSKYGPASVTPTKSTPYTKPVVPAAPKKPLNPAGLLWQKCADELNLPYAKKGTPEYDRVKLLFTQRADKELDAEPTTKWGTCCKQLGLKNARKGTPEYAQVMELFKALPLAVDADPKLKCWVACCEELGFKDVKKDTVEYAKVRELYDEKKAFFIDQLTQ
jgi:hypothetical protein